MVRPLEAFASEHDLEQVLGSGAFATVYSARHLPSGRQRAVKIMRLVPGASSSSSFPGGSGGGGAGLSASEQARAVLREVSVLASLRHPHIVRLHGVFCGGLGEFEDVGPAVDQGTRGRGGGGGARDGEGGEEEEEGGVGDDAGQLALVPSAGGAGAAAAGHHTAGRYGSSQGDADPNTVPPGWLRLGGSDAEGGGLLVPWELISPQGEGARREPGRRFAGAGGGSGAPHAAAAGAGLHFGGGGGGGGGNGGSGASGRESEEFVASIKGVCAAGRASGDTGGQTSGSGDGGETGGDGRPPPLHLGSGSRGGGQTGGDGMGLSIRRPPSHSSHHPSA